MKGLFRALGRLIVVFGRTVWSKCKITGRWISSILPGSPSSAGMDMADDAEILATAGEPESDLGDVRALAAALANNRLEADMLASVSEPVFEWLSVLDKDMLSKLLLASDDALRGHIRGRSTIAGVVQSDAASVRAYREALERDSDQLARDLELESRLEIGAEPAPALVMR